MTDLSLIIVSYNTRQLLDDCLETVFAAAPPPGGLDVWVVDNASHDGSPEMVAEKYPQVQLIRNAENVGFATANNQAGRLAQGRTILFLNSDTRLSPDALVKPLAYLDEHPLVGGLTVRLVLPTGQLDPDNHRGFPTPWASLCHFTGLNRLFPNSPRFNQYFQSYQDFRQTHRIEVTAGSYLLMPMALYQELGGWDEQYFFYGEDIDLCYRINEAGYSIIYYPEVEVIHYKGASSGFKKESAGLVPRPPRETRVKVAKESARAMKIFYGKFYQHKYNPVVTFLVLQAIQLQGWLRVIKHRLT
ncbi:MAG: glycosyltransferase family 2 protein [Anaerolineae bacterium]|nr:glycosyltransferase family 2 protein [Anaerolineae bacterium]